MMRKLVITVRTNSSDLSWLRHRCIAAVDKAVAETQDAKQIGDETQVDWDIEG